MSLMWIISLLVILVVVFTFSGKGLSFALKPATHHICSHCGEAVEGAWKNCPHCGGEL